jgi:tRNA 5-methylaminomethyl-2-thiouridine biosynthesis bifunctional protein
MDGFAPAKNPDMWSEQIFDQMTRLSNDRARVATFTSAGFVRRGLLAAKFQMSKRAGYGKKREMLSGIMVNK